MSDQINTCIPAYLTGWHFYLFLSKDTLNAGQILSTVHFVLACSRLKSLSLDTSNRRAEATRCIHSKVIQHTNKFRNFYEKPSPHSLDIIVAIKEIVISDTVWTS